MPAFVRTNSGKGRILIIRPVDFHLVRQVGYPGKAPGQLTFPCAVACTRPDEAGAGLDGGIWVVDPKTARATLLDGKTGKCLCIVPDGRGGGQQLKFPNGIAPDPGQGGCVWVSDSRNHRVRRFGVPSASEMSWSGRATEGGEGGGNTTEGARFDHPAQMVARDDGLVFVSDVIGCKVVAIRASDGTVMSRLSTLPPDMFHHVPHNTAARPLTLEFQPGRLSPKFTMTITIAAARMHRDEIPLNMDPHAF
jgi:hypothetical protein